MKNVDFSFIFKKNERSQIKVEIDEGKLLEKSNVRESLADGDDDDK